MDNSSNQCMSTAPAASKPSVTSAPASAPIPAPKYASSPARRRHRMRDALETGMVRALCDQLIDSATEVVMELMQ